jgi:hypothetical protein
MQVTSSNQQVPVYSIEPDGIAGNKHFRVYNFEGSLPKGSYLLIPHRKDHYLIVFNSPFKMILHGITIM